MKTLLKGEKRRIAITAALILFGAILFYELLEHFAPVSRAVRTFLTVVAPILYGLCFAFVVNLPMSFFEKRVFRRLGEKRSGLARGISIFISYVLVLGFIALIIALIMPKVTFVTNLGGYIETISNKAEELFEKISVSDELADIVDKTLDNLMQKANSFAVSFLQKLPKFTVNAVKVVYSLLVTLVISIHALVKKEKYITGQLVSCLIIGVLCYIGMRIFGMPYPELISVFICVAALVPIVGPWVSTIPSALIILMTRQDNPWLALWFIVMVVGIQQIDDNLVYPRIVGDAVGIPGILVISAAILAGGLFGIGGLLVAVPTAAVLYRIWCDVLKKRTDEKEKERKKKEADPEDPAEALTEA